MKKKVFLVSIEPTGKVLYLQRPNNKSPLADLPALDNDSLLHILTTSERLAKSRSEKIAKTVKVICPLSSKSLKLSIWSIRGARKSDRQSIARNQSLTPHHSHHP
jgi:hypothetical protein